MKLGISLERLQELKQQLEQKIIHAGAGNADAYKADKIRIRLVQDIIAEIEQNG